MRVYTKRLLIAIVCLLLIWLVTLYSSMIEVPRSLLEAHDVQNMEKRIEILHQELNYQKVQTNQLKIKLEEVKSAQEARGININDDELGRVDDFDSPLILPILVMACDRVTVERCLDNLVKYRPDKTIFPIIVSQDCDHNATYHVIKKFTDSDPSINVVKQPDQSVIPLPRAKVKFVGYYKIARHFKFALNYVFNTLGYEAVIIVEDDLDISPDFYEYFLGTYSLLVQDPSLWCISAWNDNGKPDVIDMSTPELLHRTDFFPGLGWMIRKHTWMKLESKWPPAFFDDWLRNPENTEGKACIRPEISRTYTFGKVGVSKGLFFENHLKTNVLNKQFVEFTKLDLNYLLKKFYDPSLDTLLDSMPTTTIEELEDMRAGTVPVKLTYLNSKSYQHQARMLGLMDDFRSGVPRTAYRGIVTCKYRGRRVYLAPAFRWEKYDPSWG
ncbi:alpha-1,3-mannosyl-glycoprotein 2-beta-N-acetylglucosaminyltransferase [Plodia interpunctella]|uniref:alpha-1,3-mannosyl-glycoprotein 2-beta-N-acetylglucosaminyltransferase n=1 Tax=Plodia interpunctella TaxID=58824 RepID=UPI002367A300|nr:alpha-1,3-mannosyl-glycoprotein 2-beta-N-acetylglucosaminyltransferase [Plodia interpunctella]XP_053621109.1 alpha-1,3-mannosyl-glycoprotein 2-beta-N-acetylglucosaminyltransferase [Plodia interpunctella]